MNNLIELLPGEHLAAAVGRIHAMGALGTLNATVKRMGLKSPLIRPQRLFHKDDFVLNALFSEYGFTNAWSDYGFGHYMKPFLTLQESCSLTAALQNPPALALRVSGQHTLHNTTWRWCAACTEEDQDQQGIAYYHRDHQLPGVLHCDKHNIGLSGGCPECGFQASSLSHQCIPPADNSCPCCGAWMAGFDGFFNEQMQCIEAHSLSLAKGDGSYGLITSTNAIREYIGIGSEDLGTLRSNKATNLWGKRLSSNIDPRVLTTYFTNTKKSGYKLETSPLLKNPRLYDPKAKKDPLPPLAYLIALHFGLPN